MLAPTAGIVLAMFGLPPAGGPLPEEMAEARQWVDAKLGAGAAAPAIGFGLEVRMNYGVVQPNGRADRPLRIGGAEYRSGLYCHANSEIVAHLPAPGKRFSATVGVDTNEQTQGGRGSVVFGVALGGRDVFASGVLLEGMPAVEADVDLDGATELTLTITDGGDGISCDQADWADARVELADGTELRLGDMPLQDVRPWPYPSDPPFSFVYDGRPSAELLPSWPVSRTTRRIDGSRTEYTLARRDPTTGLVVRCVAVAYNDFPTVEWTLWLRNDGPSDTPLLSDVQALDTTFTRQPGSEFVLHHHTGSPCTPADYEPFADTLPPGERKRITTSGGRPTNSDLPYFNIEWPGGGVIAVIGWPGQWAAEFARDEGASLHVRGGMELTHLRLRPGEEIRSPLAVLQFWKRDRLRSQNTWRRWMLAHNVPRPGGETIRPTLAAVSGNHFPGLLCNHEDELRFLSRLEQERIPIDYWWMDAGWYPNHGSWVDTGTWEVDTQRFPGGLRAISDYVHERGTKLLVWFEPERVTPGSWLYENHPEWLLGEDGGTKLLNLGDPAARAWLTDHVDHLLTEQGIDLYRQDHNIDPLPFWRANDAEDRQGITEIRHAMGYLAFYDELLRRHPGMLIDSCASGGRRNDLETLRRAVPLLRSDYILQPTANQCHTYGIASWMPYYGTGFIDYNPYLLRSCYSPWFTIGPDLRRDDLDYGLLRDLVGEWRRVAPYLLGDYYPLMSYSLDEDAWMAWQFDRPDLAAGIVQVFRRADSAYEVVRLRMRGLDEDARYSFRSLDGGRTRKLMGREAMDEGLRVEITERPGAVVFEYHRQ